MEHDYTVEKLAAVFLDHAALADQHQEFVNKSYAEQYPDQVIPEHMSNPFNAAKAFAVMAQEITWLKEEVTWLKDEVNKLRSEISDHILFEHPYA